jgi:hypothetical protein
MPVLTPASGRLAKRWELGEDELGDMVPGESRLRRSAGKALGLWTTAHEHVMFYPN